MSPLALWVECSPKTRDTGCHAKDSKMVLDMSLLNKVWIKDKSNNFGNRVAPSPTPQCSRGGRYSIAEIV